MLHSPGAIALQIGPLTLRWYGILMASAMASRASGSPTVTRAGEA